MPGVIAGRMPAEAPERAIIGVMIERLDALGARVSDILLYAGSTPPRLQ